MLLLRYPSYFFGSRQEEQGAREVLRTLLREKIIDGHQPSSLLTAFLALARREQIFTRASERRKNY